MRAAAAVFAVFLVAACSTPVEPPAAAVSDLAPGVTLRAAMDVFVKENHDVAAGVKQQLEADARYVRDFVEDVKASGFVAEALAQHNQTGAAVAP
jgi:hypothetical protein